MLTKRKLPPELIRFPFQCHDDLICDYCRAESHIALK